MKVTRNALLSMWVDTTQDGSVHKTDYVQWNHEAEHELNQVDVDVEIVVIKQNLTLAVLGLQLSHSIIDLKKPWPHILQSSFTFVIFNNVGIHALYVYQQENKTCTWMFIKFTNINIGIVDDGTHHRHCKANANKQTGNQNDTQKREWIPGMRADNPEI